MRDLIAAIPLVMSPENDCKGNDLTSVYLVFSEYKDYGKFFF